jgi:hypothetical protein
VVVAQGVVEDVVDQAPQQRRISGNLDGCELVVDAHAQVGRSSFAGGQRGGDNADERDGGILGGCALVGACQGEEAFDEPVGLVEALAELAGQDGDLSGHRSGFTLGDVERGPHHRQRGAQFVGGVGDEAALRLERGFQAGQQPINGVAQVFEFIARAG